MEATKAPAPQSLIGRLEKAKAVARNLQQFATLTLPLALARCEKQSQPVERRILKSFDDTCGRFDTLFDRELRDVLDSTTTIEPFEGKSSIAQDVCADVINSVVQPLIDLVHEITLDHDDCSVEAMWDVIANGGEPRMAAEQIGKSLRDIEPGENVWDRIAVEFNEAIKEQKSQTDETDYSESLLQLIYQLATAGRQAIEGLNRGSSPDFDESSEFLILLGRYRVAIESLKRTGQLAYAIGVNKSPYPKRTDLGFENLTWLEGLEDDGINIVSASQSGDRGLSVVGWENVASKAAKELQEVSKARPPLSTAEELSVDVRADIPKFVFATNHQNPDYRDLAVAINKAVADSADNRSENQVCVDFFPNKDRAEALKILAAIRKFEKRRAT